jgi:hypothetical protein
VILLFDCTSVSGSGIKPIEKVGRKAHDKYHCNNYSAYGYG